MLKVMNDMIRGFGKITFCFIRCCIKSSTYCCYYNCCCPLFWINCCISIKSCLIPEKIELINDESHKNFNYLSLSNFMNAFENGFKTGKNKLYKEIDHKNSFFINCLYTCYNFFKCEKNEFNKEEGRKISYNLIFKYSKVKESFKDLLIEEFKNNDQSKLTHDNIFVKDEKVYISDCVDTDNYYYLIHNDKNNIYKQKAWRIGIIILIIIYQFKIDKIKKLYDDMKMERKYENDNNDLSNSCIAFIESFYKYHEQEEFINNLKDCIDNDVKLIVFTDVEEREIFLKNLSNNKKNKDFEMNIGDLEKNNIITCPVCRNYTSVEGGCNKVICNSYVCKSNTMFCVKCSEKIEINEINSHFLQGVYNDCIKINNKSY